MLIFCGYWVIDVDQVRFPCWAVINTAINHLYGFIKGEEFCDIVYGSQDLKEGSSAGRSCLRYSHSWKYKTGKVTLRRVRLTIVAMVKQYVLTVMNVCLCSCLSCPA